MMSTKSASSALRAVAAQAVSRPARRSTLSVQARSTKGAAKPAPASASEGKEYMLSLPGITAPLGFFDPLGFCDNKNFSLSEAKRYREVEVTHGRVAMLASLGWIVQEEYHPFFGGQIGGPAFGHFQEIEAIFPQFWEFVIVAIGVTEAYRIGQGYNDPRSRDQIKDAYVPGELGFDPLGLFPEGDEEAIYEIKSKELNNGRLAMIAWSGFALQEEVDHVTIWRGLVEEHVIPAAEANLLPY